MQTIKIGMRSIEKSACLGPMASVADRAYRLMCKRYGAAFLTSEMVSAKALCYGDKKSRKLLEITEEERPISIQLFGNEPHVMAQGAKIAAEYHPDSIDINMGCPVPKVAGNGAGCALMKQPELAFSIVCAIRDAVDLPITVKFRKGWDEESINAVEFARLMEKAGASAVAVHGRTRQQMYRPPVDWEIIRQVKEAVSIPVIGNGGVTCGKDAKALYDQTGCDLVMLAQGSYGRPWVFQEIRTYLETGKSLPEPPLSERLEVMLCHVSLIIADKGEKLGMQEARKHAAWYIKGAKNAASFRHACGQLTSYQDLKELVSQLLKDSGEA